jgi:iron complex outermembrane recepter protein
VSISAYMVTDATQRSDVDQSPIDRLHVESLDRTRSFSQEVQLQSQPESPVQWVAGVYYFNANAGNIPQRQAGTLIGTYRDIWGIQKTESYSAFGQTTFPVFDDKTKLTLGLRYTADDKSFNGRIVTPAGVTATRSDSHEWNNLTYRVSLDRQLTDQTLGYASVSTGFKSGVYNVVSITAPPVAPEHLTDYEVGLKSELLDRRLRLNTAAFYYDYKDIQLLRQLGPTTLIQNAANAQLYGVETEATAALTGGLSLNFGLSLMKNKYKNFKNAVANTPGANGLGVTRFFDASGNKLQRAPGTTINLGIDYSWRSSVGDFGAGLNAYHNGGFFWDPENRLEQKAYTLTDANLRWHSGTSGFQVQLWARNIFDKQYYSYVTSSSGSPDTGAPGAPRTYGVTFAYDL